jgi:hypothetical protein
MDPLAIVKTARSACSACSSHQLVWTWLEPQTAKDLGLLPPMVGCAGALPVWRCLDCGGQGVFLVAQ